MVKHTLVRTPRSKRKQLNLWLLVIDENVQWKLFVLEYNQPLHTKKTLGCNFCCPWFPIIIPFTKLDATTIALPLYYLLQTFFSTVELERCGLLVVLDFDGSGFFRIDMDRFICKKNHVIIK